MTKEYILYKDYGRILRWQTTDEETGVFSDRVRLDTGSDERPCLMIYSTLYDLDKLRVLDGETKQRFLELEAQIKELQSKRNALIEDNWNKLPTLTWEWMKQHQDPKLQVPEVYEHKNRIVALRRGSKVMVDGSTDAVRYGIAGQVGRLKRKGKKWATVDFSGRLHYVPYTVLLPYDYHRWLAEKKRIPHSQRLRKMSDDISSALSKVF